MSLVVLGSSFSWPWGEEQCPEGTSPDQGQWGTCALYATVGAIRQNMKKKYGIVMRDTNAIVEQLKAMNFGCGAVKRQICDEGAWPNDIIEEMNTRMKNMRSNPGRSKDLQFIGKVTTKESGDAPAAHITFRITYTTYSSPKQMAASKKNVRNSVVIGTGKNNKGEHTCHAMHGFQVDASSNTITACNSWGSNQNKIVVGKSGSRYPNFKKGYIIDIKDVDFRSDWKNSWTRLKSNKGYTEEL